jgi:serine/threonine protein phosphatase PrpC
MNSIQVWYRELDADDAFMILASDGVWEFITSDEVPRA